MPKILLKTKTKASLIADYQEACKKKDVLKSTIYAKLAKKYKISYNYCQQFIGKNK